MILFRESQAVVDSQWLDRRLVLDRPCTEHLTLLCIGGGRVTYDVDIESAGVELVLNGIYLCTGDEKLDIRVCVNHRVAGSSSSQLLRGVAAGQCRVSFTGRIKVFHGAVKTSAFQTSNNIALSPLAVVQTSPQLEIYADDVQCSHGATTGMLNEDELFYMRSRGISLEQARLLQITSFLSPAMTFLDGPTRQKVLSEVSRLTV